jgi:glutamine amidotransferase-like uncharacterized protein
LASDLSRVDAAKSDTWLHRQAALVLRFRLLLQTDYVAILFAILGMQAMQQFPPRLGGAFIGVTAGRSFASAQTERGPDGQPATRK